MLGSQCVTPGFTALAKEQGIPVVFARDHDGQSNTDILKAARAHYERRAAINLHIPDFSAQAAVGHSFANTPALLPALVAAKAHNTFKGLAYLGGCGNLAVTHDARFVSLAQTLIKAGYLVVSSGCAATALAKAGLCSPGYESPFAQHLPTGVPPVIHLGACHAAGLFLPMAAEGSKAGLATVSLWPELTHNKPLAMAVAMADAGIASYLGFEACKFLPKALLHNALRSMDDFSIDVFAS